jgi:hypothetical protein
VTTTPNHQTLPARRRRHARLIAALNELIRACAEAAGAVFDPIAAAPPDDQAVEVNLLPCLQVSRHAALLLDLARAEDDARWPAAVARERAESRRTYAARCAVATRHNLAASYWHAGRLDGAIRIEEQVAADRGRILGPHHSDTIASQRTLAAWRAEDEGDPGAWRPGGK